MEGLKLTITLLWRVARSASSHPDNLGAFICPIRGASEPAPDLGAVIRPRPAAGAVAAPRLRSAKSASEGR